MKFNLLYNSTVFRDSLNTNCCWQERFKEIKFSWTNKRNYPPNKKITKECVICQKFKISRNYFNILPIKTEISCKMNFNAERFNFLNLHTCYTPFLAFWYISLYFFNFRKLFLNIKIFPECISLYWKVSLHWRQLCKEGANIRFNKNTW